MEIRFQTFRIPSGWNVAFNDLYEIDPSPEYGPDDDRSCFFKEDLLQLKHPRFNRLLDVGWYPEGDLIHGRFVLLVYEGDFHGRDSIHWKRATG